MKESVSVLVRAHVLYRVQEAVCVWVGVCVCVCVCV